jgi:hypothetical protein
MDIPLVSRIRRTLLWHGAFWTGKAFWIVLGYHSTISAALLAALGFGGVE